MEKLKKIDSLICKLIEEEKRGANKKVIEKLKKKIQDYIKYNNNILCSIK